MRNRSDRIIPKQAIAIAEIRSEIKDWASHHIEQASLVISDGLSCFNAIESADSHHLKIVTGGGAASVELPYFTWVNTMISNVKNSMHGTYHAIKRKHLPRYLGEFCYKFNHRYDLAGMLTQYDARPNP